MANGRLPLRGQRFRRSEFQDGTLYARGNWPSFFLHYNAQLRNQFSRTPGNGIPPGWGRLYHHIVRPRYDLPGGAVSIGMAQQIMTAPGGVPNATYADYIRPGTRGDSGRVQSVAAAMRASAMALYGGSSVPASAMTTYPSPLSVYSGGSRAGR